MNSKNSSFEMSGEDVRTVPVATLENVIEKTLEDLSTVLCCSGSVKSRLYEDILCMVERSLFKIALRRSNNVKSTAAAYLGINRNTFQKKMDKLGIHCEKGGTP
jgi:DNA-binding protein Fis